MDLREKPGKVQSFLEMMLRFRLIAVVVMVVATVSVLAAAWNSVVGFPIAASERFGMWFAEIENFQGFWASSQYLLVAGVACMVLLFVFGGVRSGIASIVAAFLSLAALYVLDGSEDLALPLYGVFALVSLGLLLFVKWSVACLLFPFALGWLFLSAVLTTLPWGPDDPNWLVWGALSAFGFACSVAFAVATGKHLGAGVPQASAILKAAKQMFVPVLVGVLLLVSAIAIDMPGGVNLLNSALWYVVFVVWFFVFIVPVSSFAPWERLRAGTRRVQMKDKKKKSKK